MPEKTFSGSPRFGRSYFANGNDETHEKNRKKEKSAVEKRRWDLEQKNLNGREGIAVYY
jgi:hypothetical protein